MTIRSNPAPEPTETFNAIMSFVSGKILTVIQDTATVQISDVDGKLSHVIKRLIELYIVNIILQLDLVVTSYYKLRQSSLYLVRHL